MHLFRCTSQKTSKLNSGENKKVGSCVDGCGYTVELNWDFSMVNYDGAKLSVTAHMDCTLKLDKQSILNIINKLFAT